MLILARSDVEQILTMDLALLTCREAYIAVAENQAVLPQRHQVHVPQEGADMLVMSGSIPSLPALGLKVVSLFPKNVERGQESSVGAVLLLDPATGFPAALMDGTFLTAIRTGAGSGVATDLLALPEANSVAILGTGGMAWHQLEAVCAVRPITEVYVWNRTLERAMSFASQAAERLPHITFRVTERVEEAVRSALILCAATSSHSPIIQGGWLRPGTHLNLTGSHQPGWREADTAAVVRAAVRSVDSLTAGLVPGDLAMPIQEGAIPAESVVPIGAICTGKARGRKDSAEVTLFKSVGIAAQDLVAGAMILERAKELGLGLSVRL